MGQQPTSESNFLSRLRYETHLPTPGSTFSGFFLRQKTTITISKNKAINKTVLMINFFGAAIIITSK